jgi:flagellar biosynthesis protein FlhA
MDLRSISRGIMEAGQSGLAAPLLVIAMLGMVTIPMPPFLLDLFFTFNIIFSLVVLLVVIYVMRPMDFEVFPTILLVATLLRLALNVASTRIILLEGHAGGDAAGKVIESFGSFVMGGNFAVGLVVFLILTIVNFVVVTKGAGRVSEVTARFTLDAMPGKQMAIDADLNSGFITQEEARQRREDIARESDFYGSMDGASKFVRGDAIAGILILVINIIGGLSIGMMQHDLEFSTAMQRYVLLTIGDGLVAQIPSLILSIGTAIIVTRTSERAEMGDKVFSQMFANPRALAIAATLMAVMGLIPGMPNFAFLLMAAVAGGAAWLIRSRSQQREMVIAAEEQAALPAPGETPEPRELSWDDVMPVDIVGLEVGYRLIPLVDKSQGGELMSRIKGVRKKLSQELGFLIQPVHIRDNLDLSPNEYRITLMGVPMGEAEVHPDRELAINPGQVFGQVNGIITKDPAFGLDAVWIEMNKRDEAQSLGYTVVDAATVVATHLSHLLQEHADELLGHEEVQQLLDGLAKIAPKLVDGLVPKTIQLGTMVKVLQNLLMERIPIRDLRTIAETLAEHAPRSQDSVVLTSMVRISLRRQIVQDLVGMEQEIPVITLDPALEQLLLKSLSGAQEGMSIEPGLAERIHRALGEAAQRQEMAGQPAIGLVAGGVRMWLARFVRHTIPNFAVLAYEEIPDSKQIKVVASIGQSG